MFSFMKSSKFVNIVVDDYVIRMVENSGQELSTIKSLKEAALPAGLIEYGKIIDEIKFYDFMKDIVGKWGIKNRQVRFYVPNSLVIMRHVEFPAHIKEDKINEHFMMEIGESIHLPFQNPIFDIHSHSFSKDDVIEKDLPKNQIRKGIMFAVPEDEVIKFTEIFADVSLKPIAADIKELGVYRYFYQMDHVSREKSYLFFELNLTSINLSIFHNHQVEFLRYQQLNLENRGWHASSEEDGRLNWVYDDDEQQKQGTVADQINELDRIMNFYRYSLHKGEKEVTEIIVLGDYPDIAEVVERIKQQFQVPTKLLNGYLSEGKGKNVGTAFIPALGLALKGVN